MNVNPRSRAKRGFVGFNIELGSDTPRMAAAELEVRVQYVPGGATDAARFAAEAHGAVCTFKKYLLP
jgi:hypothetical protein